MTIREIRRVEQLPQSIKRRNINSKTYQDWQLATSLKGEHVSLFHWSQIEMKRDARK